jgi:hypothetical protein
MLIVGILLVVLIIKAIKKFEKNQYILSLLITIPIIFLIAQYFVVNEIINNLLLILFMASIIFYPFTFLIKKLKNKRINLLIFLTLLIEWDWIITWVYLNKYSLDELNPLLDISSLLFFSIQKLLPLILFSLLYLISRDNKKLSKILEIILIVVTMAYAVLFIWQLYVVALFTTFVFYILPIAVITICYFIFRTIKNKLTL